MCMIDISPQLILIKIQWSVSSIVPTHKSWICRSNAQYRAVPFLVLVNGPLTTLVPLTKVNTSGYVYFRVYWRFPMAVVRLLSRKPACTPITVPSHRLRDHSIPPVKLFRYITELSLTPLQLFRIFLRFSHLSYALALIGALPIA